MKNPIRQLFGQTAVYGLGIVLPRVLNYLLLTPFYTRVFDKASYGVITELYAYVVFLLVILTYGMETGYFRFASHSEQKNTVFATSMKALLMTSLAFMGLITVFGGSVAQVLGYSQHPEYIRWLAYIVGIDAFTSIPFARIRLNNRPGKYAAIRIFEVLLNIGLNYFFLYHCPRHEETRLVAAVYNPEIGVGYVLVANLAASLLKLILLSGDIATGLRNRVSLLLLGKIWKYSWPLLIAGLAGTVNEALDRILLKHMIPPGQHPMEQLGIYGANFKMAVLMTLFVQMFKYAAEPFFFSRSEDRYAKKLYADVMHLFVAACLVIFLVVMLYLDYFILFIGADFREGAAIVPVVLMANLVMGIFFNLSIWYKLTNKTRIGALLVLLGAAITVAINVVFIPRYGYVASAWAHLFCYSTMVIASYVWSRKHFAIPYNIFKVLSYMALALLLYFSNRLLLQDAGLLKDLVSAMFVLAFVVVTGLVEKNTFLKYKSPS